MSDKDQATEPIVENSAGIDRRQLLKGASVGLMGGLAGCGGGDGQEDTTTETTTTTTEETTTEETTTEETTTEETTTEETTTTRASTEPAVKRFTLPITAPTNPTQLHFNWLNQKQGFSPRAYGTFTGVTHFGLDEGLFYSVGTEEIVVDMENGVVEYNLKDNKWWRPGPRFVDSRDLEVLVLAVGVGGRGYEVFKNSRSVKRVDERTLRVKLRTPMNPGIAKTQVYERFLSGAWEHWKQWVDKVKAARKADGTWSQKELDAIANQMLNWRQPEPAGNTLWEYEQINPDGIICSVNEGHMNADAFEGVEEMVIPLQAQGRQIPRFIDGQQPATNVGPGEDENYPEDTVKFTRPNASGRAIGFQHRTEPFGDHHVRQAVMYLVDRGDVAQSIQSASGSPTNADEVITGVTSAEDAYFTSSLLDKFPTYPVDQNKAEELLSQVEGLTKGADWWMFNEEVWEPIFESAGGRILNGQIVVDQLNQRGVKAQFVNTDTGKFWGDKFSNGTMDQFPGATYGGWRPYPFNGLQSDLYDSGYSGLFGFVGAENNQGEAPAPTFGETWDPVSISESDLEMYDIGALIGQLQNALTDEPATRAIRRLGWVYSFQLPFAPLYERLNNMYFRTKDWTLDIERDSTPNHFRMKFPFRNLTALGRYYPERLEQ